VVTARPEPAADRAAIAANLAGFRRIRMSGAGLKAASVAVCVVLRCDVPGLLITRRARACGRTRASGRCPAGAATRASQPRTRPAGSCMRKRACPPGRRPCWALLDDYVTRSGYLMTPVVVWGGQVRPGMRGLAAEVAEIHVIPLADLDVPPRLTRIPESESPVIQLPLLGRYLHAPTAAIVYQFCQVALHGRATRVAHFEQPVFAWK
jgi:hypothetical protein